MGKGREQCRNWENNSVLSSVDGDVLAFWEGGIEMWCKVSLVRMQT